MEGSIEIETGVGEECKEARLGSACTTLPGRTSALCRNRQARESVLKPEEKQKHFLVALHSCILVQLCKGPHCN